MCTENLLLSLSLFKKKLQKKTKKNKTTFRFLKVNLCCLICVGRQSQSKYCICFSLYRNESHVSLLLTEYHDNVKKYKFYL